jgi:hypothetical protein
LTCHANPKRKRHLGLSKKENLNLAKRKRDWNVRAIPNFVAWKKANRASTAGPKTDRYGDLP